MGHFILQLPTGEQADVREGIIQKKTLSLRSLFGKKWVSEKKRAYIIHIGNTQYRLLRSMDGVWLTEGIGNFQPTPDDGLSAVLKEEINKR